MRGMKCYAMKTPFGQIAFFVTGVGDVALVQSMMQSLGMPVKVFPSTPEVGKYAMEIVAGGFYPSDRSAEIHDLISQFTQLGMNVSNTLDLASSVCKNLDPICHRMPEGSVNVRNRKYSPQYPYFNMLQKGDTLTVFPSKETKTYCDEVASGKKEIEKEESQAVSSAVMKP